MRTETELPYRRIGPKDDNNNNGGSDSGRSDDGSSRNDGNGNDAGNDNSNTDEHRAESTTPPCPHCGKTDKVIPIIYGMPPEELFREQQAGKLRLGGCCVSEDGSQPEWYCKRDREVF